MKILNVLQGSNEWLEARRIHHTASEAAAALGQSKYSTRSSLLMQKATGASEEIDDFKQELFDKGHAAEAGARAIAEEIVGSDLYPVTAVANFEGLDLLASLDGATMDEEIIWEHKLYSESLASDVRSGHLHPHYTIQMDHQLLVSGAKKCLFMTSDGTRQNMAYCWYEADQSKFDSLIAGWKQFAQDLAAYVPPEVQVEAVGRTPESLPALRIEVTGLVTASNLEQFKEHALAVFKGINRDLQTDQDFADAEKTVKWCGDVEDRLKAAKAHALAQTESIDVLFRAIDDITAEARATRLELEKLVKARKEAVRAEILQEGVTAMRQHIDSLNARLGKPYMPAIAADFAGAMKGKKTVASLRDAVATTLANAKIEANAVADRIQVNLSTLRDLASEHAFLFADTAQIVLKPADDCTALIKLRIAEHKEAEEKRLAAERERIAAEERAKAEAKVRAEQEAAQAAARQQAVMEAAQQRRQSELAEPIPIPATAAPVVSMPRDTPGAIMDKQAATDGKGIMSEFNACQHRHECRALLAKAQQPSDWNAAIEAAAKVCDERAKCNSWLSTMLQNEANYCADAIRSLLRPAAQEAAREQPADERKDTKFRIDLSEEQATRLRDYIGNGDREITLAVLDAHAGTGLYAFDTDYLDEGGEFIRALAEKGELK